MLSFFPTPYPDELWYSVLCRYHMRTGYQKHATTIQELFRGKSHAAMGAFFPNNAIRDVMQQLPDGFLKLDDIVLNHTLFKYHYRMASMEKKLQMLEDLHQGRATVPTHLHKTSDKCTVLRYCPLCYAEDSDVYGEPYWHTEHQIPIISVCSKHKCRLIEIPIERQGKLNEQFFLPIDNCRVREPDYALKSYEPFLADTLHAYHGMPLQTGPTPGHNNLAQALANEGYALVLRKYNLTLDSTSIYRDLRGCFGDELTKSCFGEEAAAVIMTRITKWTLLSPERYAMLATLIRQPAEVTFSETAIESALKIRLQELQAHGTTHKKKYIAAQLGIQSYQLDAIAKIFGIEPCWADYRKKCNDGTHAKNGMLKVCYSEEEKAKIERYCQQKNFANLAAFLRFCIASTMERDEPKVE